MNPQAPGQIPPSGDLRVLLIIMGVLTCIMGFGCGCGMPAYIILFAITMASFPEASSGAMSPEDQAMVDMMQNMEGVFWLAGVFYLLAGAAVFWLGLGCCMCKRWSWKLMLSAGWMYIEIMVLSIGATMAMMIPMMNQVMAAATPPGSTAPTGSSSLGGIEAVMIGMTIVSLLVYSVPGIAVVIVFGLRNVRLTCEFRDQTPRWTDNIPVPVLIAWMTMITMGCSVAIFTPMYAGMISNFAMFDIPLLAGIFGALLIATLGLTSAWFLSKMKALGLVLGIAMILLATIGGMIYMGSFDVIGFYRQMGIPEADLEQMAKVMPAEISLRPTIAFSGGAVLVFLLSLIRYFLPGRGAHKGDDAGTYQPPAAAREQQMLEDAR